MIDKLDKDSLNHISSIIKVKIDSSDFEGILEKINTIIDDASVFDELDLSSAEPVYNPLKGNAPLREDVVKESLSINDVLGASANRSGEYFKVPKTITSE